MKIAITGGTGFVGRHLAASLGRRGHEVVLVSRLNGGLDDVDALTASFAGCEAVAHCAGINRELGLQTYQRVHVDGTRQVVTAAEKAGVERLALVSFLRARPWCGSGYHESKWTAEELVRASKLATTVLKAGVIYGRGDHMLDHLSHAFHTFPLFGLVGFRSRPMRPTAVEDVVAILEAALVEGRLSGQTVAVTGPEELTLEEAVRRVASVVGKRPLFVPLPVAFHRLLALAVEAVMRVPLVSTAQVRILSEGLVEAAPPCDDLPDDLKPKQRFTDERIRAGLPEPGAFTCSDLRTCSAPRAGRCAACS